MPNTISASRPKLPMQERRKLFSVLHKGRKSLRQSQKNLPKLPDDVPEAQDIAILKRQRSPSAPATKHQSGTTHKKSEL